MSSLVKTLVSWFQTLGVALCILSLFVVTVVWCAISLIVYVGMWLTPVWILIAAVGILNGCGSPDVAVVPDTASIVSESYFDSAGPDGGTTDEAACEALAELGVSCYE